MADGGRSLLLAQAIRGAALTMLLLIASSAPSQNKVSDREHVSKKQAPFAPFSSHPIRQQENWTPTPSGAGPEPGGYFCVYNVEFKDANYRKTFEEHQAPHKGLCLIRPIR